MLDFIINPHSRSGAAGGIWERTKKILDERGVVYRVYRTEYPGHASRIAEQLTRGESGKSGRRIVILGGDGTVNEVVNGLAENVSATLAYIPTGSGNDLARSLGIIHDTNHLREAVEKILHPSRYRLLDYGEVSTDVEKKRRFLVSSGIGFDAAVCHNLLHSKAKTVLNKLHLTKLCYIAIGVKQLILALKLTGIFFIGCFTARFLIEYIKNPQEAFEMGMVLNMGQILSIPFIIAGIILVVRAMKRPRVPIVYKNEFAPEDKKKK